MELSQEIIRFMELARTGNEAYASSGEVRARRIALALLDDISGLDDASINGFIDFVRAVQAGDEMVMRKFIA